MVDLVPLLTVPRHFRGPPMGGNGGYCCGLIAKHLPQPATAMLKAMIPLDAPLDLTVSADSSMLTGADGVLLGQGRPADTADLADPPLRPGLAAARQAQAGSPYAVKSLHRGCFSCCIEEAGALGVVVGQVEGQETGVCAGVWTPDASFADEAGVIPSEIVWAAMDCPGSMAWGVREGRSAGLLGAMTCEIVEPVRAGQPTVVVAWPIAQDGRKFFSGVGLLDADGGLLARARQTWIRPSWSAPPA
jgi:hypothetical protein